MREVILRAILSTILWMGLAAGVALAQSEVGGATLNGTVTDQSGAAVPNARVAIVSPGTGLARTTSTSGIGLYTFPRLSVGTYDLTVDAPGFKTTKRTAIQLQVGAGGYY